MVIEWYDVISPGFREEHTMILFQ
jgi:hypothetical protein